MLEDIHYLINYQAIGILRVWYWLKDKHIDPWNRRENPYRYIYGQLIMNRVAKAIQWKTYRLLDKWCWTIWISISKNINFNSHSYK